MSRTALSRTLRSAARMLSTSPGAAARGAAGRGGAWGAPGLSSLHHMASERCPTPNGPPASVIDFHDPAAAYVARSTGDLRRARWMLAAMGSPCLSRTGIAAAEFGLRAGLPLTERLLDATIFSLFCGGKTLPEATARARDLARHGVRSILDYAAEGERTEAGFDRAAEALCRTLAEAERNEAVGFCALKVSALGPTETLARQQAAAPLTSGELAALDRTRARLARIAGEAARRGVPILIDAEESWIQGAIDALAEDLMAAHNREAPIVFTTLQMYRRDQPEHLDTLTARARRDGFIAGVKLVRGAYLRKETERAQAEGRSSPIQPAKPVTDAAYDAALTRCLESIEHVALCAATHNVASVEHLLAEMRRLGITAGGTQAPRVSCAQLLGMADNITFPLARAGVPVLKYLPYGSVREVFPYLVRRAEENESVLQQSSGELARVRAELARRAADR